MDLCQDSLVYSYIKQRSGLQGVFTHSKSMINGLMVLNHIHWIYYILLYLFNELTFVYLIPKDKDKWEKVIFLSILFIR